ncbi:MAG: N-acetylglucosamine-6-phosphate deacetylase, partial [Pseudomonadota bacterium]
MSAAPYAVAARCVFDGLAVRDNTAVLVDGPRIAAIMGRGEVPETAPVCDLPENAWLAPGLIDIQINGGGDVLFND